MMRFWRFSVVACSLASMPWVTSAQADGSRGLRPMLEAYIDAHQRPVISELIELLSIPNLVADTENIERNASHLRRMLDRRGFRAEVLRTDGNPFVYGDLQVPGATRTILLYAHYDGQPVDPPRWKQRSPFVPVLRDGRMEEGSKDISRIATLTRFNPEWRLYARSAADNKAPIVALCAALDALKASGIALTSNLRVLIDGEHESSSPSLAEVISAHREKLTANLMVLLDDPVHPRGGPTVVFGARGGLTMELTTYGPKVGVHSGHYGNWVPNPAIRLAHLLASMKDDEGYVLVKGFYDGIEPLHADEEAMLRAVPDDPPSLMKLFGIAAPERQGLSLQEALQLPSLNIRGLTSAYTGPDARTIIPDTATAALDIRLVKETGARAMIEKIMAHIRARGYYVMESDPDALTRARQPRIAKVVIRGGTDAYRTSPLLPESRQVVAALERMFGERPVQIRTSGASVPAAAALTGALGFPAISLPIVNFDNNQHGENENLRLGHLFTGIESIAAILTM
jgi:acetylornithine deacetylase/succinyl-diaminopimelate desuccinylase-like protein